ncbi:MAG TPA: sulfotransferase [Bryobacteraceae bacterium]|nr:sulfotransferase [Bryobacteraceae bacterium]
MGNGPIFIVGGPRSGTTLLRNMLNRHPEIAICRETEFFHWVFSRRRNFGSLSDSENRRRVVKEYLATQRIQRMRVDLGELSRTLLEEAISYPAMFLSLMRFFAATHGKRRCGEKTPHNGLITELLYEWYPDASVIQILRDPRDAVASMLRMPWASKSVVSNARMWLRFNLGARRSSGNPRYLLVRYEELVNDPEAGLRGICNFLGEEYSPAMLEPNADASVHVPWFHRAEQMVTTERLGKWREELTTEQVALAEWAVGDQMRRFGYQPAGIQPSRSAIARDKARAISGAIAKRMEQFPAAWYYFVRSTHLAREEALRERYLKSVDS